MMFALQYHKLQHYIIFNHIFPYNSKVYSVEICTLPTAQLSVEASGHCSEGHVIGSRVTPLHGSRVRSLVKGQVLVQGLGIEQS